MIAAGNLFTSCIQQLEPTGIQEMREAKAEYYEALAGLKNADAAKVLAEAEVEKAKAAVENAIAAQEQAKATILELKAEAAAMNNEQKAAEVAAAIDSIEAAAALAAVKAEEDLAKAEAKLAKTLDNLAVQAEQLTWAEQLAVSAYVAAYEAYLDAQDEVYDAEKELWEKTNAYRGKHGREKYGRTVEETLAGYEAEIAEAEADIALYEARIEEYEAMSDAEKVNYGVWKAEYDSYVDSVEAMKYESAEIEKAKAYYNTLNADAFGKFTSALELAQKVVDASVSDARAGFKMEYTVAKGNAFPLPEQKFMANGVVDAFRGYVKDITPQDIVTTTKSKDGRRYVEVVSRGDNAQNKAKKAIFGDEDKPEDLSLEGIIDALERDSVVVDQFVKDTAGIGYLVDSLTKQYKAVKDTLSAGISAYPGIAAAVKVAAEKAAAYEAALKDWSEDEKGLKTSIDNFVKVWNEHADGEKVDSNDSLAVWNAFIDMMKAREVLPYTAPAAKGANLQYFYYDKYNSMRSAIKDSVKFSEMQFSGIQTNAEGKALYAGTLNSSTGEIEYRYALQKVLRDAFHETGLDGYVSSKVEYISYSPVSIKLAQIDATELVGPSATDNYKHLFFEEYWLLNNVLYVAAQSGAPLDPDRDIPDVKEAKDANDEAQTAVKTAKTNFYKNFYCKFWGLNPAKVLNGAALKNPHDSLRINFTEKTYTEPTVVAVFKGEGQFFHPATGNAKASIDWRRISLMENAELEIINDQIDQNGTNGLKAERNIRSTECPWTLYAQALAASEFQELAKNYKENTEALALLRLLVTAVELAYVIDSENVAETKAMADSLVTAYLGEDMVEYIYAEEKDNLPKNPTPYDIWNKPAVKRIYVIDPETVTPDTFYAKFCVGDKFFLGGLQLEAAEQFIPDFAETIYGFIVAEDVIDHDTDIYEKLEGYLSTYVKELAKLDGYKEVHGNVNVDQIYAKIQGHYDNLINDLKEDIEEAEGKIALAEEKIAKLEAGFDPQQIAIEAAMIVLAKAEADLEARETELAAATAAYQQVLENHDME